MRNEDKAAKSGMPRKPAVRVSGTNGRGARVTPTENSSKDGKPDLAACENRPREQMKVTVLCLNLSIRTEDNSVTADGRFNTWSSLALTNRHAPAFRAVNFRSLDD